MENGHRDGLQISVLFCDPLLGVSWVIQAEDLKNESRKENHSNSFSGPGPCWFEPWTSTKPWREPLREKNWQEQQHSHTTEPAAQDRCAESKSLRSSVKLTLQVEALIGCTEP